MTAEELRSQSNLSSACSSKQFVSRAARGLRSENEKVLKKARYNDFDDLAYNSQGPADVGPYTTAEKQSKLHKARYIHSELLGRQINGFQWSSSQVVFMRFRSSRVVQKHPHKISHSICHKHLDHPEINYTSPLFNSPLACTNHVYFNVF